jgi:hypothetical protein
MLQSNARGTIPSVRPVPTAFTSAHVALGGDGGAGGDAVAAAPAASAAAARAAALQSNGQLLRVSIAHATVVDSVQHTPSPQVPSPVGGAGGADGGGGAGGGGGAMHCPASQVLRPPHPVPVRAFVSAVH